MLVRGAVAPTLHDHPASSRVAPTFDRSEQRGLVQPGSNRGHITTSHRWVRSLLGSIGLWCDFHDAVAGVAHLPVEDVFGDFDEPRMVSVPYCHACGEVLPQLGLSDG